MSTSLILKFMLDIYFKKRVCNSHNMTTIFCAVKMSNGNSQIGVFFVCACVEVLGTYHDVYVMKYDFTDYM